MPQYEVKAETVRTADLIVVKGRPHTVTRVRKPPGAVTVGIEYLGGELVVPLGAKVVVVR